MNRSPQKDQENYKSLVPLSVSSKLWDKIKVKPEGVSAGDKEMLSAVIGVYAFVPGLAEQIRYLAFLRSKIMALLLKKGRYEHYKDSLKTVRDHWATAVNLSNNDEDWDFVIIMLSDIEEVLQGIAEAEGLTANTRDAYRGEVMLPGPIKNTE